MNDHGSSQNIGNTEPFIIKGAPGIALVSQKGKQISGVLGMSLVCRVKMCAGILKLSGTVSVFMDVEGIKPGSVFLIEAGKAKDLSFYKDTFIRSLKEFYKTAEPWGLWPAYNPGHSLRPVFL